jgi:hypothetical protein
MKVINGKTHFNISDVARALGKDIALIWRRIREQGTMPEPTVKHGRREFYTAAEFHRIVEGEQQ